MALTVPCRAAGSVWRKASPCSCAGAPPPTGFGLMPYIPNGSASTLRIPRPAFSMATRWAPCCSSTRLCRICSPWDAAVATICAAPSTLPTLIAACQAALYPAFARASTEAGSAASIISEPFCGFAWASFIAFVMICCFSDSAWAPGVFAAFSDASDCFDAVSACFASSAAWFSKIACAMPVPAARSEIWLRKFGPAAMFGNRWLNSGCSAARVCRSPAYCSAAAVSSFESRPSSPAASCWRPLA